MTKPIKTDVASAASPAADLRDSAEFRTFLERKRTVLTRELDDLDSVMAAATREHNDWQAVKRQRHEDLSFVLAQVDAALAIEPLPAPVPRPAPAISSDNRDTLVDE